MKLTVVEEAEADGIVTIPACRPVASTLNVV